MALLQAWMRMPGAAQSGLHAGREVDLRSRWAIWTTDAHDDGARGPGKPLPGGN